MKRFLILLVIFFSSHPAIAAECAKPVTAVKTGDMVKCDGFLFSRAKEKEVRYTKEQLDLKFKEINLQIKQSLSLKTEVSNYVKALKVETQKTKEWEAVADKYTAKYEASESSRLTRDVLMFGAGILFTVVVGGGLVWIFVHVGSAATAGAAGAAL